MKTIFNTPRREMPEWVAFPIVLMLIAFVVGCLQLSVKFDSDWYLSPIGVLIAAGIVVGGCC